MLGQHGRGVTKKVLTAPVLALARIGVSANMLTVTGTVLSVLGAIIMLGTGKFVYGPAIMGLLLVADSCDGILARATGTSSTFGAFLDSTLDRLADGAVFGSLTFWAAMNMPAGPLRTWTVIAGLITIVMAATVSYSRARAESVGAQASVGIAERTDRLIVSLVATFLVGLGAPQWVLSAALSLVAVASFITVLQRVFAARSQLRAGIPEAASAAEPGNSSPHASGSVA